MIKTHKKYNEVLELLKYIPLKNYLKIPDNEISYLKTHQDLNYSFKYNLNEPISNQNISKEALIIFTKLYLLYIADSKEKATIKSILTINDSKSALDKNYKNDYTNLFKKSNAHTSKTTINSLPISHTNKGFLKKILSSLQNICIKFLKK